MIRRKCSMLFLGKKDDEHVEKALKFCLLNLTDVTVCLGKWGDELPENINNWNGEYIVSYLSRWIVPTYLLKKARIAAINFHPGPPEYPGFGCYNFALYENAKEYGVTCHHMADHVDTGDIIAVRRFPILPTDNVSTLITRTHDYQLVLFYEIMSIIIEGRDLPKSEEKWKRRPFTRRDLNELSKIMPDMSKEEIIKRIRATSFDTWKPFIELHGLTFELKM